MTTSTQLPQKSKSIIRWEAIIPTAILLLIIGLYFHLLFDTHLRRGLEWAGYSTLGAEVNIEDIDTSFFQASLKIKNVEITNAEDPTFNSVNLGEIRFSMLWDALLRAKIVVNEAAVEQVAFNTKRKSPGKIKPPKPISQEPGMAEKLKDAALQEAQEQAGDNVLGDVIALLGGEESGTQVAKIESSLESKKMLQKFDQDFKETQRSWSQRLKTLPQSDNIQELGNRLSKIKTKDFKSPQEVQSSLQEFGNLLKDGESMFKQVKGASDDFTKDMKLMEAQYKRVEEQIKVDAKSLEQHFRIPKIDANTLSAALFNKYLGPYKAKFFRYKKLAETYLPPRLLKKDKSADEAIIAPHVREKGISYEFGRLHSYPLFWIKRTAISSQAGSTTDAGNIKGEILNISSNQQLTGMPTVVNISGDFPSQELENLSMHLALDNTKQESDIKFNIQIGSYKIGEKELVSNPDIKIAFHKARGQFNLDGKLIGLKRLDLKLANRIAKIDYAIASNNPTVDEILKYSFAAIPVISLNVNGHGDLPNIPLDIESNLGAELQKGLEKQIQAKIDEARIKIQTMIDSEIGKQKREIENQLNTLKGQIDLEVKKKQSLLDDQKKQAETRMNATQKEASSQGRKQLEKEGQKAVDDLKKRFGL